MSNIDNTAPTIARISGASKTYRLGKTAVHAVRTLDLEVAARQFTVIAGPSGSGKSTLLHLLGALDQPDTGHLEVAGQKLAELNDEERSEFRLRTLGFVFQNFNLLPVLTALENVEYPMRLARLPEKQRRERAQSLLAAVGLADKGKHRPLELSGGQRQRVAVARALANEPALILADEPTANLDRHTGAEIIALLRKMQKEMGTTVIFSSHDPAVLAAADTRVTLIDGQLSAIEHFTEGQTS